MSMCETYEINAMTVFKPLSPKEEGLNRLVDKRVGWSGRLAME
jgi:hypothetical protein